MALNRAFEPTPGRPSHTEDEHKASFLKRVVNETEDIKSRQFASWRERTALSGVDPDTMHIIKRGAVAVAAVGLLGVATGMLTSEGHDFDGPGRQEQPTPTTLVDGQIHINNTPSTITMTTHTES